MNPSLAPVELLSSPCPALIEPLSSPCRAPVEPLSSPCRAPVEPLSSPCRAPVEPLSSPCRAPVSPLAHACTSAALQFYLTTPCLSDWAIEEVLKADSPPRGTPAGKCPLCPYTASHPGTPTHLLDARYACLDTLRRPHIQARQPAPSGPSASGVQARCRTTTSSSWTRHRWVASSPCVATVEPLAGPYLAPCWPLSSLLLAPI